MCTYDDKVDYGIDPSNDKKACGDPEKSYDSDRQSKGQAMEEVHESKFD